MATTSTIGIVLGSVINYEISFNIPANTIATQLVVTDTFPLGLQFATSPGAQIKKIGDANWASTTITVTPDATDPTNPLKIVLTLSDTTILQPAVDTDYVMSIPLMVINPLDENSLPLNGVNILTTGGAKINTVSVRLDTSDIGIPTAPVNFPVLFMRDALFVSGGNVIIDNVVSTADIFMDATFHLLNSIDTTNATSPGSYTLQIDLPSELDFGTLANTVVVGSISGVLLPAQYTITPPTVLLPKRLLITIPLTDAIRGEVINAYVPYRLTTVVTPSPVEGSPAILNQTLTLTLLDNSSNAITYPAGYNNPIGYANTTVYAHNTLQVTLLKKFLN